MERIDIEAFEQVLAKNLNAFDTRSELLFKHDGIKGVKHLPLEQVQRGQLPDLGFDEPIYLICEYGHISELVGLYLETAGFKKLFNVEGGMKAWRRKHKQFKLF
jgi:rhodanese-related sulfurtransferase